MIRFVTKNSVYWVDSSRYMRQPIEKRTPEEQSIIDGSWRLVDNVWHALDRYAVEPRPDGKHVLRIWTPDAVEGIRTSPLVDYMATAHKPESSDQFVEAA